MELKAWAEGNSWRDRVFFLAGMLPFAGPSLFSALCKNRIGAAADIHIFPGDEGDWILLLDATDEEAKLGMAATGEQ